MEYSSDPAKGSLFGIFCGELRLLLVPTPELYSDSAREIAYVWKVLILQRLGVGREQPPLFHSVFAGLSGDRKQFQTMLRHVSMEYRCVATSVAGFVQQLVSCYLSHGYWFYVSGVVPEDKDPMAVDEKLLAKYEISISRQSRARRKAAGGANLHYIRFQRRFLLLATHGRHLFYDEEAKNIRDARKIPIRFAGYSISVARGGFKPKRTTNGAVVPDLQWRVRVRIDQEWYNGLKAYMVDVAARRSFDELTTEFQLLPFEPYAPVRQQLLNLVRWVNRNRAAAHLEPIPFSVLRYRRRIIRPFDPILPSDAMRLTIVNSTAD